MDVYAEGKGVVAALVELLHNQNVRYHRSQRFHNSSSRVNGWSSARISRLSNLHERICRKADLNFRSTMKYRICVTDEPTQEVIDPTVGMTHPFMCRFVRSLDPMVFDDVDRQVQNLSYKLESYRRCFKPHSCVTCFQDGSHSNTDGDTPRAKDTTDASIDATPNP
nr:hypothetical protein [Tanacetum cinerariifolium]